MTRRTNPQNNLPEPLGVIVLLANFCFGLWNVYSNLRQESKQAGYDKRQQKILQLLDAATQKKGESYGSECDRERDQEAGTCGDLL